MRVGDAFMGKLVLIGGGENGYHKDLYETEAIDSEITALADRKNPRFLFTGLANGNPDGYYGAMRRVFGKRFGCRTEYLTLQELNNPEKMMKKVDWADIIYAAGGNTLLEMRRFRKSGLGQLLMEKFLDSDAVFCGLSAGAICWCAYGASDSYHFEDEPWKLTKVSGLGFADLTFCPHYTTEPSRKRGLTALLQKEDDHLPAVALDYASLVITDEGSHVTAIDDPRLAAYLYSWQDGAYQETPIEPGKQFTSLRTNDFDF